MYGKIFVQMYDSTVCENWKGMVTFQQLIALADKDGCVDMTPSSISRRTNIPLEIIEEGIDFLEKEDRDSRSKEENGRRIIPLEENRAWGWRIVNYVKYRDTASHEDKKERWKKYSEKRRYEKSSYKSIVSPTVSESLRESPRVSEISHTDTDTDTDKIIESVDDYNVIKKNVRSLTDSSFVRSEILETFEKLHVKHRKVIPIFTREITEKARQLARTYTVPRVLAAVSYFFEQDQNSFVTSRDYSFGIFFSQASRIMQELEGVARAGPEKKTSDIWLEKQLAKQRETGGVSD